MENLDLRVQSSQAKSIGTLVLITGALIVTLYKGSPITVVPSTNKSLKGFILSSQSHWALGGFFLAVHSVVLALYYIIQVFKFQAPVYGINRKKVNSNIFFFFLNIQAWIIRDYPAELMVTLICCIFVTILSATVSLVAEKDANAWKLGPNIDLMAIGYSVSVEKNLC